MGGSDRGPRAGPGLQMSSPFCQGTVSESPATPRDVREAEFPKRVSVCLPVDSSQRMGPIFKGFLNSCWQEHGYSTETLVPLFLAYQTVETMDAKESEFPQESDGQWRKGLKSSANWKGSLSLDRFQISQFGQIVRSPWKRRGL